MINHWFSNKSLPELMLTQFIDAYMRHLGGDELTVLPHWPLWDVAVILNLWSQEINFMSNSFEIVFRWMPQNTFDDKSALVQAMAQCHQAPNHHLSQFWPWYISPYGINGAQWLYIIGIIQRQSMTSDIETGCNTIHHIWHIHALQYWCWF